ncbi:MAG TPA: hypothetical protein VGD98_12575 [Ktedonobacteraceae bacterium]
MAKAEMIEEVVMFLWEQMLRGNYGVRGYLPSRSLLKRKFGISHSMMTQAHDCFLASFLPPEPPASIPST